MKIALFGAGGVIGSRILHEALERGHLVTAVVRDLLLFNVRHPELRVVQGDATNAESVAKAVEGHDAVVSSVGPGPNGDPAVVVQAAHALLDGCRQAGVKRLLVVGGAGSLMAGNGMQLMDTPMFPVEYMPIARAHRDALNIYRDEKKIEWTFLSPPTEIAPGPRTGTYRANGDSLIADAHGKSQITTEDFAVAVVDELERPKHKRQRFTVAY
jgi:putative NADH-flavin reductase